MKQMETTKLQRKLQSNINFVPSCLDVIGDISILDLQKELKFNKCYQGGQAIIQVVIPMRFLNLFFK